MPKSSDSASVTKPRTECSAPGRCGRNVRGKSDLSEETRTLPRISREDQTWLPVDVIVDTGFDGHITVPPQLFHTIQAERSGLWYVELGDGNVVEMDAYLINVKWLGKTRRVIALQSESEPLIGITMLWGNRVTFDAVDGGMLSVVELQN